jgi:DDE domain
MGGTDPNAIRTILGRRVVHRTSAYKNNGLEQDHRGVKGRTRCKRGFKSFGSAERFCRSYDELRDFFRPRTRHNQPVRTNRRRLLHLRRTTAVLIVLETAWAELGLHLASSDLVRVLTEPTRGGVLTATLEGRLRLEGLLAAMVL